MTDQPSPPPTDDEVRELLRQRAREGYATDEEVVEGVSEELGEEHGGGVAARVEALAPGVFEALDEEEAGWPVPTDCDRLDRAFAALERAGIVARQHFTCCQTCGHAEIGAEIRAAEFDARGYTFFHVQDTEGAVDGGGLCLAYGAVMPPGTKDEGWDRGAEAIGREVAAALRAEGLDVAWNGQVSQRLSVALTWRRRRPRE